MASVAPIPGSKNHLMMTQLSFPTLAWVDCIKNELAPSPYSSVDHQNKVPDATKET
jgi:hypothetical protein